MDTLKTISVFALALLAAPTLYARTPFVAADSLPASPASHSEERGANPQSQKTIKDTGEYNAYIAALNTQDPAAKAAAMEAFLKQYPASIVKMEALEQAMGAYQQAGNAAKVQSTASLILELEPDNVRALAILAYIKRAQGTPQSAGEARVLAQKGQRALITWMRPDDMDAADFKKLRNQMDLIFYGAIAFGALQDKDYSTAQYNYQAAFAIDPSDLQNAYQLGIADLEMDPKDINGFWYLAKAFNLAQGNAAAQKSIDAYGRAKYKKYRGGEEGWDNIVLAAAAQVAPPAGFAQSVKHAPTPAEIAVQALKDNDPATLSFSDYEFVLSYRDASAANKEAAEKVWNTIVAKEKHGEAKLKLVGVKVIHSTRFTIDAAITEENQKDSKVDLFIILDDPLVPPLIEGSMIDVIGVLTEYRPDPFRFTMRQAQLAKPPK